MDPIQSSCQTIPLRIWALLRNPESKTFYGSVIIGYSTHFVELVSFQKATFDAVIRTLGTSQYSFGGFGVTVMNDMACFTWWTLKQLL